MFHHDAGDLEGHAKGTTTIVIFSVNSFNCIFTISTILITGGNAPTNSVIKETAVIALGFGYEHRCLKNKGISICDIFDFSMNIEQKKQNKKKKNKKRVASIRIATTGLPMVTLLSWGTTEREYVCHSYHKRRNLILFLKKSILHLI